MSNIRKLPAKYSAVVMPLLLSMLMSGVVSGISTVRAVGLAPDVLGLWTQAWGLSWAVAFPVVLIVLPIVRRLTALVVEKA